MKITIRQAAEDDFPAVLSLIRELAEYEKELHKVTNTVGQMKAEKDLFRCYVAETENGEMAGMVIFFFVYYTWVGKSLYLEDIYVRESFRKQGIGSLLMDKIFEIARAENCRRVRWQVLDWNKPAIEMYRKCGAVISGEWLNCNFEEEAIRNYGRQ